MLSILISALVVSVGYNVVYAYTDYKYNKNSKSKDKKMAELTEKNTQLEKQNQNLTEAILEGKPMPTQTVYVEKVVYKDKDTPNNELSEKQYNELLTMIGGISVAAGEAILKQKYTKLSEAQLMKIVKCFPLMYQDTLITEYYKVRKDKK